MLKQVFALVILLVLTQSCFPQKVQIFENNEMNNVLLDNINYFNKVSSYKKIYIKQNRDTLYVLNIGNITFKLENKHCTKYRKFDIIVDDENDGRIIKLNLKEECLPLLNYLFNNDEENNLYGSIYSVDSIKNQKSGLIVRGDLEALMPYLKSIMTKRVKIEEPKDKIPVPIFHSHPTK